MGRVLADFPFLILLLAGALACCSAVALRRAAPVVGAWTDRLAAVLRVAGWVCFVFSFLWAWDLGASRILSGVVSTFGSYQRPTVEQRANPWVSGLGVVVFVVGLGMVIWGVRVKGWVAVFSAAPPRHATNLPYARVKRPIGVGMMLSALGFVILVQSLPVLVCLAAWIPLTLFLLELEEWEMRARHPSAADYLRRTPRYLPLRGREPLS